MRFPNLKMETLETPFFHSTFQKPNWLPLESHFSEMIDTGRDKSSQFALNQMTPLCQKPEHEGLDYLIAEFDLLC